MLPFENLGGTPEDERLARGFRQDMITELARFPALGVLAARSSESIAAGGLADAPASAPAESDYLVSGSVRRSGQVIRVGAQLVDARTGQQLWADRYDRPGEEVFSIQDEITARVANALNARLDQQHLAVARRRSITALAAYEIWLRGFECLLQGNLAADEEARAMFQRALEIDPQFARGHAGLSLSYFNEWSCDFWSTWGEKERLAFEHARRAEALDPHDQIMQVILGRIEQYRRRHELAQHHFQRALALAPNDAETLIQLALYVAYQGDHELAVSMVERGLDLNPLCPPWQYPYAAATYFIVRDYERCLRIGARCSPTGFTDLPAYFAAAHAYLGQPEQAVAMLELFDQTFAERIAPGRSRDPLEPVAWLCHVNPFRHEEGLQHLLEGLRRARAMRGDAAVAVRATTGEPDAAEAAEAVPTVRPWPIANMFRREGALWMLCYEKNAVQMPELKGFCDIAHLLGHPGEEFHCMTLAGREDASGAAAGSEMLDERARREYQARISELRAEIEEASDANDPGRAARAQAELDALVSEIGRATGLGGRSRKLGDPAERARSAVTWRIRNAVKKIGAAHPTLGRHLANSLQTGVFCRYSPERPTDWEV
ncbi:MAG: hypothetical protein IAE82_09915 [Opitutaceae bacterium]|nr:hypothetical protein [Opitutaceae bacterium]